MDTLLTGTKAVNRLVELGPSTTLTGMARKTIARYMAADQRPGDDNVEFLSSKDNTSNLCYHYEPPQEIDTNEVPEEASAAVLPVAEKSRVPSLTATIPDSSTPEAAPLAAVTIEDVPVKGHDIIRALVARKLKKPIADVPISKSIKELCNGKSTLQNELVGIVHNEFESIPDMPEDLSIKDLGEAAAANASDLGLGKSSLTLLMKLVSAKMPPRFNLDSMKAYLAERWGLGHGRLTLVLLFAMTAEPEARLTSTQAAHQYLDGISSMYAAWAGLTLQVRESDAGAKTGVTAAIDHALTAELDRAHKKLVAQQLQAFETYLHPDSQDPETDSQSETLLQELQSKVEHLTKEFSDDFLSGVRSTFDPRKARRYNAYWRAARQELLQAFDSFPAHTDGQTSSKGHPLYSKEWTDCLKNKADSELAVIAKELARKICLDNDSSFSLAAWSKQLAQIISEAVDVGPKTYPASAMFRPTTTLGNDGKIQYLEVAREGFSGVEAYVDLLTSPNLGDRESKGPFASIKTSEGGIWTPNQSETRTMLRSLARILKSGTSFEGKRVLVTGVGEGSICGSLVRLLLEGGARVIVCTSRSPSATASSFQQMYETHGARGSELTVLQFNQASSNDCNRLVDHIYDAQGLDRDLDAILPFAAMPEGGVEIQDIGADSELVHRLMLTNVFRLLGRVIKNKRERGIDCNPTQVLLPLSPNHGIFGSDGLYAESKLGLESLLNRVNSESWSEELSICGVKIGWTRSTGLMHANDIVAETMEENGVLTFSVAEMALNMAVLLTPEMREACENQPLLADFSGGLDQLEGCQSILAAARTAINQEADIARAIRAEDEREELVRHGKQNTKQQNRPLKQRSLLKVGFPSLPDYEHDIRPLQQFHSLPNPADSVVVVGFAELGPFGTARLRWEMESRGRLGQTALVEIAWLMGLVTHADELRQDGHYVGWIDAKTREPVADDEIEQKYGSYISEHIGLRALEPKIAGYDPERKESVEHITVEEDLPPFETSAAVAEALKLKHGEDVAVRSVQGTERKHVQLRRGAVMMLPKAAPFQWGNVAGQLPSGFAGTTYGIPEDLARQLDPVSVMAVCSVAEAFYSAGISDPLEIFKHIHLSEIGNFIGSSMGGALKTRHLYRDVFLGKEVDTDSLQDTYSNTTAAWVNMLLLGSSGPIKTPVGACATGVESIDSAFESIMSGKTKMGIVGGVDDLQEDEAFGFSMLKATVNAEEERARGRLPSEMSRPTAESRSGFVEAHGCGVQLLCRGDVALKMGLPIYGIIAGSAMAADGVGKSVPAPGQGILSFAREDQPVKIHQTASDSMGAFQPPGLRSPAEVSTSSVDESSSDLSTPPSGSKLSRSSAGASESGDGTSLTPPEPYDLDSDGFKYSRSRTQRSRAGLTGSPMRDALRRWGLDVDDISVASLHGTSTKANDINEPEVICAQMEHLGRTRGLPMWAISQKAVTGHPKAPAAAWMLNGCLQAMNAGLIPGNRNADNQDVAWKEFIHLCLPTTAVEKRDIKAFLVTSFGFGQKGGQVIGIAPRYLFATQSEAEFRRYSERTTARCRRTDRAFAKALMGHRVVRILQEPPYEKADAHRILLDVRARICDHRASGSYRFDPDRLRGATPLEADDSSGSEPGDMECSRSGSREHPLTSHVGPQAAMRRARADARRRLVRVGGGNVTSTGVDVVFVAAFDSHESPAFVERNYTAAEQKSIAEHVEERAAFAGRWAAKEAVFKCLSTPSLGAGAAMKEIEILSHKGVPRVSLSGEALAAAQRAGLEDVHVSVSYEADYVVAIAFGLHVESR